jgi:hypothetical protein
MVPQDALGGGYDAHADGTGFFALQSCANHSCEPNAHTLKVSTRPQCCQPGALSVCLSHRSPQGFCRESLVVQDDGIWLRVGRQ